MKVDQNLIRQLVQTLSRQHPSDTVELRETHISWVILCGEYAYKIKKPVNFGFLDFSTRLQRHHFCREELRLNSRFAPEIYLAVVPVALCDGQPNLSAHVHETESDDSGNNGDTIIDYAVQMRRFDEQQLLDNIARRGDLNSALLRSLARELALLHQRLPVCRPPPDSDEAGTPRVLLAAARQNFQQINACALDDETRRQLAAVEQWTLQRYAALSAALEQRVRAGKVIDGHGDVHLGNIALINGQVRLFDCIEFNPALRIMDRIAEAAFLTMDMDARGYRQQSRQLLVDYLEYSGDYDGLTLLDLYRCYYAMVRAKVNLLRAASTAGPVSHTDAYRDFLPYLQLAGHYTHPRQRFVAITHGLSGSGKSTVAGKLAGASGAIRIRSDVERKRLFGLQPEQRSQPTDEAELYSRDMTRRTFERLEHLAASTVRAGFAVIIDATFLHRVARERFHRLADDLQVPFVIVDCTAPDATLRQRLAAREQHGQDASEAGIAVMEQQRTHAQPLTPAEQACRLPVNDSGVPAADLWLALQTFLD